MKKLLAISFIICLIGIIAACSPNEEFLIKESYKPIYTDPRDGMITLGVVTPTPLPMVTEFKPQEAELLTPAPTPTPTPSPSNPTMYTSYAYLVSYNPSTHIAAFDYFDLLQGDKAVDWLVESEGYTLTEAQEYVAGWADSEFIVRNLNPQLRMIDLSNVPYIRLMYYPSGKGVWMVTGGAKLVTIEEVNTVYAYDSDLLLNSYFFRIVVNSAEVVTEVEQVFWP